MANSLRGNTWHHFLKDTSSKGLLQKTIRKKKQQQHSAEPTKAGTSVKVVWPFKRAWVRDIKLNPLWGPFLQRKSRHVSENCGWAKLTQHETCLTWTLFGKGFLEAHSFETHPNERMCSKTTAYAIFVLDGFNRFPDFRGFHPPEDSQDMSLDWREVSVTKSTHPEVNREGNPIIVYITSSIQHAIAYNSV